MTTLDSNTSESRLDEAYQRVDSFIEEHLTCSGIDFSFPALDGTSMQTPEGSRSTSIRFSNGPPLLDLAKLPYYGQSSKVLRKEIWGPGVTKRRFEPKKRGNYVRNSVFSNLRIEAKMTRLPMTWNLETLWDRLPAELLISIFNFLHPIDLYHAICASKVFRRFLLARNSTSIWRKSFLNHPDIPLYPKDVSAPKWSSWIFGPANCDTCGEGNCLFDYAYRYRKCDDCTASTFSKLLFLKTKYLLCDRTIYQETSGTSWRK
ncbi:hypothetical protein BDN70DRAFT_293051 [Pholiota conissans]|uniref:F-box domain-containing protein n=1 Tax=Pholiota conissans TaxID=109636 RepID=A0A9P5ZA24_9AGAR|nr:hypothetical protein BDN70DRAFT_293051 [Pholiota conissans]